MRTAIVAALFGLAIAAQAQAPVPRPAGELTIVEPNGNKTLLSSTKGKVVLVQFLDTTCPHCQALSQLLNRLQAEFGPQGFQAFGVATFSTDTAPMAEEYKKKFAQNFPVGYAKRTATFGYLGLSLMQQVYVPQVILIDRSGTIVEQTAPKPDGKLSNETYLRQRLTELLKKK